LQETRQTRLNERTKATPFKTPPELEEKIVLYKRLLQALDPHHPDASLQSLLYDSRLDGEIRAELTKFMNAKKRARYEADFEAYYPDSAKWHSGNKGKECHVRMGPSGNYGR
jgi:hypothetical protein